MDLVTVFVNKAFEWGVGKTLDVLWQCVCEEKKDERIANVQFNHYECPNCHKSHRQFTNACNHTIASDGRVSQVGVNFGNPVEVRDNKGIVGDLLGWKCICVEVPLKYQCDWLAGQDLIEVIDVSDLATGEHLYRDMSNFKPTQNRAVIERIAHMPRSKLGDDRFKEIFDRRALLAYDISVKTRYEDLIFRDRALHKLRA